MNSLLIRARNNFITGVAVLLPIVITILLIWFLFQKTNIYLLKPAINLLEPYLYATWMIYIAKIIIFLLVILLICSLGFAAKNIIMMRLFGGIEKFLTKVPLVGKFYKATKQISNAFLGAGKTIFKKVVVFEYPRKGVYSIGFVTSETEGEVQAKTNKKVLSVFLPTTPNPTSGVFLLVPVDEAIVLDMNVEEALKMIISGGNVLPEYKVKEIKERKTI